MMRANGEWPVEPYSLFATPHSPRSYTDTA
jgi:hypothetical protein